MTFQTPHYGIPELLGWCRTGHLQLPDFQRAYKWDDERIRALLVTIVRDHPMGVLMTLETGGQHVRFKPKPVAGAPTATAEPSLLLLDGQQRTTSLYQALTGDGVVDTEDSRHKRMSRRYFLDIAKCLGTPKDQDDAVISVPADGRITEDFGRIVTLDLSTSQRQQERGIMPFTELFSSTSATTWLLSYMNALGPEGVSERSRIFAEFNSNILTPLLGYKIPAIQLASSTSKEAVATVFEKVNSGGLPLDVFELLTAIFAGDATYYEEHGTDFRLIDDWNLTEKVRDAHPVLSNFQNTDLLQACSVLITLSRRRADQAAGKAKPTATSARKEDILDMDLRDYLLWSAQVRGALPWVAAFLHSQHIHTAADLPYRAQVTALVTLRVLLGPDIDLYAVRERLRQWFWCGALAEQYGGTIETLIARDAEQVAPWAMAAKVGASGDAPETVVRAQFAESRLLSLKSKQSAAYKAIYALMMAQPTPCMDWRLHQVIDHTSYTDFLVDIHHVFPKKWCVDNRIDPDKRESIVNKTPLSKVTNIQLGGLDPRLYMSRLDSNGLSADQVDDLIRTHAIDPAYLRAGDFDAYFADRRRRLVALVEAAMGKAVNHDIDSVEPAEGPEAFSPIGDDPSDTDEEE